MFSNMFPIKIECEEGVSVCRGCLSAHRKIVFLTENTDLFFSLMGAQKEYCTTPVMLCWECVANLRQVQKFQNRIQHAQFILQQSLYFKEGLPITSLSTFKTVRIYGYNDIVEHQEQSSVEEKPVEFECPLIKEESQDADVQSDETFDTYQQEAEYDQCGNVSDNEELTIDLNNLNEANEEPDRKSKRVSSGPPRHQSIKLYMNKTTVKKLDVDVEELKKRCAKVTLSLQDIEELLERDKGGKKKLRYNCTSCKKTYRRSIDLNRHTIFQHLKGGFPAKCSECKASIDSREALESHWLKHNVYYKCDMCGWLSHSLPSMTKHHYRVHTRMYCCNSCDYNSGTLRDFSNHYKVMHERTICDHCGKSFLRKRALEIHIKRHHTPATCHACNRTYAHYHVLENHYRMYHPQLIRAETSTELSYCVECDKQFPSVYKYRRHLATAAKHTPPKPVRVPCPECDKVFSRKIRMTNHYNSVHVNTTKHRCDICNKTFCSAFSARTHRQHVHEKIPLPKNKMCDICGRGFSTNRILTNHRRTHTGERPFKCVYCPATFAQRTAMKTHEKTQHKVSEPL